MTTIGLIRHGSTEWNHLGKLQGQLDTELTDEGRAQARLLGKRLRHEGWLSIICSDLWRAKETAMLISEESGIPIHSFDPRLRERSFGLAEGTTHEERAERWGPHWKQLDLGGESDDQLWSRWLDMLEEITISFPPNEKILLVTHGSYIAQILRGYQMEPEEFLQNTSLTILNKTDSSWTLALYNSLTHLDNMT